MVQYGRCGFVFIKYALAFLNVFYLGIGIILVVVASVAKASAMFTSLSILGGIVACGVFLIAVAIFGIVGALKHHQVMLFFYMVFLGIIFAILFSVSIAALSLTEAQRHSIFKKFWESSSNQTKIEAQIQFDCCGFNNSTRDVTNSSDPAYHPDCTVVGSAPKCGAKVAGDCPPAPYQDSTPCCETCYLLWQDSIEKRSRDAGGLGLFFSLTVIGGLIFTYFYRNRKDPSVNPRAFL